MNPRTGSHLRNRLFVAVLALVIPLLLGGAGAWAAVQYLGDGALPNSSGGWDLPNNGSCYPDATKLSRPECLALRFPAFTTSATCISPVAPDVAPYIKAWSTGSCNDLINTTQAACEAQPDRLWNNGICAVVMKGDDRNNVVCALHQGTWITTGTCTGSWVMPASSTYTPPLFTGTTNPSTGDQCLRCHNSITEWNGPRIRDVDWYLRTGHKNMSRPVTVGMPWAGPAYECTVPMFTNRADCEAHSGTWERALMIYPSDDSGNVFDWGTGTISVGGVSRDLTWIYGDWLSALPRAIYKAPASTSKVCSNPLYTTQTTCESNGGTWIFNAGASYSCARCHTTGWTSDAAIGPSTGNLAKLPERMIPGITWDRNSDAPFGVVNLSSGVTGDANRYASWDYWGIACSRCHSSAVDNTTNGGVPPYSAPTGMSSHHSVLTSPDAGSGYCTDSRFTLQAQCTAAGGTWLTACSNGTSTSQATCEGAGAVWYIPSCNMAGICNNPLFTTQASCEANNCSDPLYTTQATCETNVCSDPLYTTQPTCLANGGTWAPRGVWTLVRQWAAATDVIRCEDIDARWTGSKTQRGPIITALCMQCHRQETGGAPYDSTNPGTVLKVGPAHGTVAFVSHPHGNMFLNSPHGKFTGTFSQIATGKFNYAMTGEYKSFFQIDGEAANTGNGCTGCHDVHKSVVEEAFEPAPGQEGAIREECTACHAKSLTAILHPKGTGTPLEEMDEEPAEACVSCHMPDGMHMFRVNADPSYSTFPATALTATVNANTTPDGTFTNAVWVDIDHACGQCHGGGTAQATTTGDIASGSKVLTVASTTGFTAGQKITVADAGALGYDDEGLGRGDFETYIVSVAAPVINLAGAPSLSVTGKSVVQNATRNGAGYMTKTQLAALAENIHNDKPYVNFATSLGSPNTLTVNVDASGSTCSGSGANCDAYDWSWGDGTPDGSGVTASHTYATGGVKTITLTVEQYGVNGGSVSRTVTVYAPDTAPTVAGVCAFNADTWTETLTDTSTDDNGIKQVTVNWGDGSILGNDTTAPFGPFSRTYLNAGTYTITHKAIDTIGQQRTRTCTATPAYFTISGTVFATNGTTVLPSAMVTVKKGLSIVKTVYTAANGTFSAGTLKPGTYTLTIVKSGYTFAIPAATITVGPSSSGNSVVATGP